MALGNRYTEGYGYGGNIMLFREIRQFCAGLRSATFPTPSPRQRNRSYSPLTRHLVGRSVALLSLAIIATALAVLIAAGLSGAGEAMAHRRSSSPLLSPTLSNADLSTLIAWDTDVSARDWTAIVLHHSATDTGSAESFDAYHRLEKGWHSLGYHFVIGNGTGTPDGAIEAGPRWRRQEVGAHARSAEFNRQGIGICLVGNFEHQPPTPAQLTSTGRLVRELARRFQIPPARIMGHCDIREGGGTACPGKWFPLEEVRGSVTDEGR